MSYTKRKMKVKRTRDKVKGGYGDNKPDKMFLKKDLQQGIKVEMEHTNDPSIAKEIVKDHIVETGTLHSGKYHSAYYTELAKLEKRLKR